MAIVCAQLSCGSSWVVVFDCVWLLSCVVCVRENDAVFSCRDKSKDGSNCLIRVVIVDVKHETHTPKAFL